MQKFISTIIIGVLAFGWLPAQTLGKESVLIETTYGNIRLRFYEETPLHSSNFLKLADSRFFDSLLFHRVIHDFMIQGGDPLSKAARQGDSLGHGDLGYTLPAEIHSGLIHKKGALCAARESDDINPQYRSSASQFYIVVGKKRSPEDLKKYEVRINKAHYAQCVTLFANSPEGIPWQQKKDRLLAENKTDSLLLTNARIDGLIRKEYQKTPEYVFSPEQREVYTTLGGTPHLDNTYTVFGEVTEGLEVVEKIAAVKTDPRDRPQQDIRMRIRVIR